MLLLFLSLQMFFQLDQLPEGTEVQVRPIPPASTYKKMDGWWVPVDSDHTVYGEPLVRTFPT